MTWIILLFALGIVLLAMEVIIPGGILGIIGALMIFGGCALSYIELGTKGGTIATVSAIAASIAMLWVEFKLLPKTRLGQRAFLKTAITGVSSNFASEAQALVGKPAEAMTTLSPSGYVRINGKRYDAFCQTGHTEAGTAMTVVGCDSFRLIVSPTQPDPQDHA